MKKRPIVSGLLGILALITTATSQETNLSRSIFSALKFEYADRYATIINSRLTENLKEEELKKLMISYERSLRTLQKSLETTDQPQKAQRVEAERKQLKQEYDKLNSNKEPKHQIANPPPIQKKQREFILYPLSITNRFQTTSEKGSTNYKLRGEERTLEITFQTPYKQTPKKATLVLQVANSKQAGTPDTINVLSNKRKIGSINEARPNQELEISLEERELSSSTNYIFTIQTTGKNTLEISKNHSAELRIEYR